MRELIINRLNEFRESESNFSRNTMRWRNFKIVYSNNEYHLSEIQWEWFDDAELLKLYTRIVIRLSKVM